MKKMRHRKWGEVTFSRPHIHEGAELGLKPRHSGSSDGKICHYDLLSLHMFHELKRTAISLLMYKLSTSYVPLHLRLSKLSRTHYSCSTSSCSSSWTLIVVKGHWIFLFLTPKSLFSFIHDIICILAFPSKYHGPQHMYKYFSLNNYLLITYHMPSTWKTLSIQW